MSNKMSNKTTKLSSQGKKSHSKEDRGSNSSRREKWAKKHKGFLGNKQEGQGFADKRKKKLMHDYHKMLKKERNNLKGWSEKIDKLYKEEEGETKEKPTKKKASKEEHQTKISKFHKAKLEWTKNKEAKDKRQVEIITKQKERDECLAKYKQRKKEKHKKLSKRNYKGQPNMASQMEVLLKQIESQTKS